ncbi:hypothetical protein VTK73DRAFT_2299 [Phialemonium thermophilum]|uniref:Uncharacterized protein n=1 Tax=Phialemonium thermophilum TaxID=223376 RepID=A0ABR3VSC3_9PEZI
MVAHRVCSTSAVAHSERQPTGKHIAVRVAHPGPHGHAVSRVLLSRGGRGPWAHGASQRPGQALATCRDDAPNRPPQDAFRRMLGSAEVGAGPLVRHRFACTMSCMGLVPRLHGSRRGHRDACFLLGPPSSSPRVQDDTCRPNRRVSFFVLHACREGEIRALDCMPSVLCWYFRFRGENHVPLPGCVGKQGTPGKPCTRRNYGSRHVRWRPWAAGGACHRSGRRLCRQHRCWAVHATVWVVMSGW